MEKKDWSYNDMKQVAWRPYEQAMNTLTNNERVFIVTLTHEWLAVGKKQKSIHTATTTDYARGCWQGKTHGRHPST